MTKPKRGGNTKGKNNNPIKNKHGWNETSKSVWKCNVCQGEFDKKLVETPEHTKACTAKKKIADKAAAKAAQAARAAQATQATQTALKKKKVKGKKLL